MNLKLFITCLLIGLKTSFAFDINDDIANAIKAGNSKAIAAWFTDNVDLKVLDQEDVYSKAQAELIVKDFFTKHPVKSFSIAHKSSKNDSQFAIGTLETTNGKYRIYFLLKKSAEKLQIQQFRIEPENE
ncbi:MAG: DUF4783 domain-containing protein [Bacteroidetes bacterium]|nr:DUF4783 domain-containing protein [Bacteroidota bacterium]